jgi:hypothetical protein
LSLKLFASEFGVGHGFGLGWKLSPPVPISYTISRLVQP